MEPTGFEDAVGLYNRGQLLEAEAACKSVLEATPAHVGALTLAAECQRRRGNPEEATRSLQAALRLAPDNIGAMVALADIYIAVGRFPQAAAQYRKAIPASARPAAIYMSLAMALKSMSDMTGALEALQAAVSAEPGWAQCHYVLAQVLLEDKQIAEAIDRLQIALSLKPDYIEAHILNSTALAAGGNVDAGLASLSGRLSSANSRSACCVLLANQLIASGYRDQAVACLERRLELEPADAATQHEIAALTGSNPASAPKQFVRQLFDDYADAFDHSLLRGLAYSVPRELLEAVTAARGCGPPWDILDLGCGTGLIGTLFAAHARSMVGVDLSERMIARTRERGIYSQLICADLLESVERMPSATFDLVIAADVFVYVGKLDAVMPAVRRVLRPGGTFAFSAEDLEKDPDAGRAPNDAGYWLHSRARYAHRLDYLNALAAQSGFEIRSVRETRIRFEEGRPVHGWLMICV